MKRQDNGTPCSQPTRERFCYYEPREFVPSFSPLSRLKGEGPHAREVVVARKYETTSSVPLTRPDGNVGCNDTYFTSRAEVSVRGCEPFFSPWLTWTACTSVFSAFTSEKCRPDTAESRDAYLNSAGPQQLRTLYSLRPV